MVTNRRLRRLSGLLIVAGLAVAAWMLWPEDQTAKSPQAVAESVSDERSERAVTPPAARRVISDGQLHGRVQTAEGNPAASAEISIAAEGATPLRKQTDTNGAFEAASLPEGLYYVTAWKDGLVSERTRAVVRASTVTEINLVLEAGASLAGTVRDASDGSSVTGCQLTGAFGVVPCDHGGRFVLGPLVPGTISFRVGAPGYTPRDVATSLTTRTRVTADITLTRGAEVSGTVFDPDHKPFAGARIRSSHYVLEGAKPAEVETVSDKAGHFTLDGIAPGRVRLQATAPGYADTPGVELQLAGGEHRDGIELTLTTGGAIAGTVKDGAGQLIEGAQVQALRLADKAVAATDRSAADGSFRLDGVAEGEYTVVAATAYARGVSAGVTVTGREEATVNVILGDDSIDGVVRTESGSPVSSAVVSVFSSHAAGQGAVTVITDGEGKFRADGLIGAPFRVEAHADGLGSVEARGIAAGAHVELVLSGSGRIEGVVTAGGGRGLESFEIRLIPKDNARGGSVAGRYRVVHLVSPDGTFRLDEVPAGKYLVKASAPNYLDAERPTEVPAGGTAQVSLSLGEGATVTGHIRLPDGSPAVGCDVHPSSEPVVTDAAGTFKLTGLERHDGFVFVWARCADGMFASDRATLDASGHGEVLLRAKPKRDNNFDRSNVDFGGVGMSLRTKDSHIYASSVFEGGPAFLAGIQDGDEVVSVDGWPTAGASVQDVANHIRGPLGTPVVIGILRSGTGIAFDAHAERARIALD